MIACSCDLQPRIPVERYSVPVSGQLAREARHRLSRGRAQTYTARITPYAGRSTALDGPHVIRLTCGAGFIGANFVLDRLRETGEPLVNLDALTAVL